jgi:hypothetical protein
MSSISNTNKLQELVEHKSYLFIQQVKEWGEILTNFETRNKYSIMDQNQVVIGYAAESSPGLFSFIVRQILRRHRPMKVQCFDNDRKVIMHLDRPFYFFFSDLTIMTEGHQVLGHVRRRFSLFYKKYDLCDEADVVFATVQAPFWNIWTFPILDMADREIGVITKKWGGLLKELFTDADRFGVQLPESFSWQKKAVVFGAALSIDMDYFDDNQSRN